MMDRYDMFPHLEDSMSMTLREWMLYHHAMHRHHGRYRGRRILKTPFDWMILSEIIEDTEPELIVEIGALEGGCTHWMADFTTSLGLDCLIIAVDVNDVPRAIEHERVQWMKGDATTEEVAKAVHQAADGRQGLVIDDADHKEHTTRTLLERYHDLVRLECYFIVEDTHVEHTGLPPFPGPSGAIGDFLAKNRAFIRDRSRERHILTHNPGGYLLHRG